MSNTTKQKHLRRLNSLAAAVTKAEKAYEVAIQRRNAALRKLVAARRKYLAAVRG